MRCFALKQNTGNPSGRERLEECILQMAGGAADTLAVLYEQTKTAVYGFALSILRNQADAEDVLQETYLHIYQAAGRYKPNGNPMPWIFTITRNLALMKIRESKRRMNCQQKTAPSFGRKIRLFRLKIAWCWGRLCGNWRMKNGRY